jgi:capsular exopolysaccharide synthesis family protein
MGRAYEAFKKAEQSTRHRPNNGLPPLDPILSPNAKRHRAPRITWDLDSTVEEDYQKLRGNLFLGSERAKIKSILMVAARHGEGTTTTATILASVLSKANHARLLLVDANLRSPSLAEVFRLTDDPRGFTDLMMESVALDEIIRPTPFSNLSVITSGRPLHSPAYLFDAPSIEKILGTLYERYDLIILDGPPVHDYADASFLSSMMDGTILVVQAEKTKIDTVQEAKRQLERAGARLLGTVLNKKRRYIPAFLDRWL